MRKTIVIKGKKLVYSSKYHGYIDPEWHGDDGIGYQPTTIIRFKRRKRIFRHRTKQTKR